MVKRYEGNPNGSGRKIAVVVSRFNDFIGEKLLDGCLDELQKLGMSESDIIVASVPGAYELPLTALKFAKKKDIDAVICLGAVIRGETFHFEVVALGAAQGLTQASLMSGKPVILGVLTTDTVEQAYQRCEENDSHKGREAAVAALEMADLFSQTA